MCVCVCVCDDDDTITNPDIKVNVRVDEDGIAFPDMDRWIDGYMDRYIEIYTRIYVCGCLCVLNLVYIKTAHIRVNPGRRGWGRSHF